MKNKFIKLNSVASHLNQPSLIDLDSNLMALSVDKSTLNKKIKYGVAREVYKRAGDPTTQKFLDKSRLIIVTSRDLVMWKKAGNIKIKKINEIIKKVRSEDEFFIGLEDPDIYKKNKKYHLFFTIAFRKKHKKDYEVHLGHAQGKTLDSLKATKPSLLSKHSKLKGIFGFKEISIFPSAKYALTETGRGTGGTKIALVKISAFRKKFKFVKVVLDPQKLKYKWCNGELSTAPMIINVKIGKTKYILAFVNGREKPKKTKKGNFAVGLILINSKTKNIDWISPNPLISDPDSKGITFASDFVQIDKNTGYLYVHINDSFVRTYKINLEKLKQLLPKPKTL